MKDWFLIADSSDELAHSFGHVGVGVFNNAHFEKETFVLRRCLLALSSANMFDFPLCISRADGQGEPDFFAKFGDGPLVSLEVVEATTEEDARESAMHRQKDGFCSPGDEGGRPAVGLTGEQWTRYCIEDLQSAIQKKLSKPYASGRLMLLVYLNGNPSMFRGRHEIDELIRTTPTLQVPKRVDVHILLNDRTVIVHAFSQQQNLLEIPD